MISFPNAKINLGLNVVSRRSDGYHDLISCFYPISWKDSLEIIIADSFSFSSSGLAIPGEIDKNLVVKAYDLIRNDYDISPVSIHLRKVIPMGAGIGGGSSDAAFCLKMLNEIFELNLGSDKLKNYAKQLGADCPFFINNKPKIVKGIGDIFEDIKLNLSGYKLVVVYPNLHINTGLAFQSITPSYSEKNLQDILVRPVEEWRETLVNDFEKPVFKEHPLLSDIKVDLYRHGAIYVSMSGSGSSIYGVFKNEQEVPGMKYQHFVHFF